MEKKKEKSIGVLRLSVALAAITVLVIGCKGNRTHSNRLKELAAEEEVEEVLEDGKED